MADYEKPPESNDLVAWHERVADEDWKSRRDGAIERTVGNGCPGCGGTRRAPFALFHIGLWEWVLVEDRCPMCA